MFPDKLVCIKWLKSTGMTSPPLFLNHAFVYMLPAGYIGEIAKFMNVWISRSLALAVFLFLNISLTQDNLIAGDVLMWMMWRCDVTWHDDVVNWCDNITWWHDVTTWCDDVTRSHDMMWSDVVTWHCDLTWCDMVTWSDNMT